MLHTSGAFVFSSRNILYSGSMRSLFVLGGSVLTCEFVLING